jgi:hypothetical protein
MSNGTEAPADPFNPDILLRRSQSAFGALFGNMNDNSREGLARSQSAGLDLCNNLVALAFEINNNLNRIACAVEAQTELMHVDIQATIDAAIKSGLNDAVNQAATETAKRSYIGKKPT